MKMIMRKVINSPRNICLKLMKAKISRILPDAIFISCKYYLMIGKKLHLSNPTTFNEKIQWLKLHDHQAAYSDKVDKFEVRAYIANVLGEEYLIPLLGVWDNFDEIDFDHLPAQFVLKCTHDSGGHLFCRDKSSLDLAAAKKTMTKFMQRNYFYLHREWPYKNIRPRIIAEQYMVDETGSGLKDFKVMCFNGKARCIFVCQNRDSLQGLNVDIYDLDWQLMPFGRPNHPRSNMLTAKPATFDLMVKNAELLSRDMRFARIDFYEINRKLYFGEITLYPASGFEKFEPEGYDQILGNWLDLGQDRKRF